MPNSRQLQYRRILEAAKEGEHALRDYYMESRGMTPRELKICKSLGLTVNYRLKHDTGSLNDLHAGCRAL